jgi:hypothetical protein
MADTIIPPAPIYLDGTASLNTYMLNPDASVLAISNQLSMRQKHLESMLYVASNSDPDSFADKRDLAAFMWACRSMAMEIRLLTDTLITKLREEVKNG